ncbi:MAG: hypothetical protein JST75_17315 [Bacteroidetes bacterium]|nr:hypothetical protein [Bacteroidota bacterium]
MGNTNRTWLASKVQFKNEVTSLSIDKKITTCALNIDCLLLIILCDSSKENIQ